MKFGSKYKKTHFIHENTFENFIYEMSAISYRGGVMS